MSYGPGPSLAGTLFTNASNSTSSRDAAFATGICPCPGGNDPGGGCSDSCSCEVPLPIFGPSPPPATSPAPGGGPVYTGDTARPRYIGAPPGGPVDPCAAVGPILPQGQTNRCVAMPLSGIGPGCVVPATRIALFPEGCMAAAEVQPGDLLLTRKADGTLAGEVVTAVRTSTQPRVLLETEEGRQLPCSLSHEVMVADPELPQGRCTVVSELTLSDRLLREDGTAVGLRAMVREPDGLVIQISLLGPGHLYLSDGLWSHNKNNPVWP
ncbi:MAG: hypothetical protein JWL77_4814 [Chthonomonadaceae bacterium]|nr:hypothetical protein [Chthonomonadaceae bacterium]